MNNRINEDEVISDLFKSFNQDNVILFVGSSAIDNGELTEKICNLPWSCVITTSKKDGFGVEFANGSCGGCSGAAFHKNPAQSSKNRLK